MQFRVQVSSLRPRGTLRWPSAAFRSEPCSEQSRVSCDSDGATSILSCINGCVNCSQLDEICLLGYSGRVTLNVQEKPNLGKNDENKQRNYRSLHPARHKVPRHLSTSSNQISMKLFQRSCILALKENKHEVLVNLKYIVLLLIYTYSNM